MTIGEMKMIYNMSDASLVGDVSNPPVNDTTDHTLFKILVLKDRGKLADVIEFVKILTAKKGDLSILQREFLSRHHSADIIELKNTIERGYFLENQVKKSNLKGKATSIEQQGKIAEAGHHLKQLGANITEWLIISLTLVAGFVLGSMSGVLNYQLVGLAYIIYGIYQLVFIIRIASLLKKAGESLINHE